MVGLVEAVRPARPHGHATAWETLLGHEVQIRVWVAGKEHDGVKHDPLSITKIEQLLAGQGVPVPYRRLHRFAAERCGFRTGRGSTLRVADGEPGWSASSTSPSSACSPTPRPPAGVGCTC